jgi:hypothetical protein
MNSEWILLPTFEKEINFNFNNYKILEVNKL